MSKKYELTNDTKTTEDGKVLHRIRALRDWSCGCFQGNLEEFEAKVKKTHGDNRFAQEYGLAIDLAKKHFEVK